MPKKRHLHAVPDHAHHSDLQLTRNIPRLVWWDGYVCLQPQGNEIIDYRKVSVKAATESDAADAIHNMFPERGTCIMHLHRSSL